LKQEEQNFVVVDEWLISSYTIITGFTTEYGGRRVCDLMVIGFTTTCAISAHHH